MKHLHIEQRHALLTDHLHIGYPWPSGWRQRAQAGIPLLWADQRFEDAEDESFTAWSEHPEGPWDDGYGAVLIARDAGMEARWDEQGYALDHRQEGPVRIAYEAATGNPFRILALEAPYRRSEFSYEPYEMTVACPLFYLVTLTTPDGDSRFSTGVFTALVAALSGT